MARLNKHHITYDPEWVVQIPARWHREITYIQRTKPTPEFEKHLRGFVQALTHEWHRVCLQLYQVESKNMNPDK